MLPGEDVQRQIAVFVVVAVKESAFLVAVQGQSLRKAASCLALILRGNSVSRRLFAGDPGETSRLITPSCPLKGLAYLALVAVILWLSRSGPFADELAV